MMPAVRAAELELSRAGAVPQGCFQRTVQILCLLQREGATRDVQTPFVYWRGMLRCSKEKI